MYLYKHTYLKYFICVYCWMVGMTSCFREQPMKFFNSKIKDSFYRFINFCVFISSKIHKHHKSYEYTHF